MLYYIGSKKIKFYFKEKEKMANKVKRQAYPTDLNDKQWEEIESLYTNMRTYKWDKRELTNAVLYLVNAGCKWRQLPHDFPPYSTVHSFYRRARQKELWDRILDKLVKTTRKNAGRTAEPSYALIDSQSVKTVSANKERGFDGGKKRKAENGILLRMLWEIY